MSYAIQHAVQLIPLPSAEMRETAAEVRALREALEAITGDVVAAYGRVDGLIQQREERLLCLYRAQCQGMSHDDVLAQVNARG
ncbi:hypothetical protein DYQ93_11550 [Xanthomonas sp. LMG 8992]|uniref:hypothetical protein n=1 Tax=Xanthomonas sp. LMG 8992 TaxID=1591157 RepID=UPI00136A1B10|nr:hypothetical protein [Xanthomonas sp. LMG 8992]MXV11655.1 hypothetical protein [Xanthomonas sp. LMG 8992]